MDTTWEVQVGGPVHVGMIWFVESHHNDTKTCER